MVTKKPNKSLSKALAEFKPAARGKAGGARDWLANLRMRDPQFADTIIGVVSEWIHYGPVRSGDLQTARNFAEFLIGFANLKLTIASMQAWLARVNNDERFKKSVSVRGRSSKQRK
jgi:protein involved in temperature-dependent protein secretion